MTAQTTERERARQWDAAEVLVCPYVTWIHLALAYEPISRPTEARIRTLRTHHACPAGVTVHRRTSTGVAGSSHWYSSLGLWSAILLRNGREGEAFALTQKANTLRARLAGLPWEDLIPGNPSAELIDLARTTDEEARNAIGTLKLSQMSATWAWIHDDRAIIETVNGDQITLPLDSPQLAQSRLGDPLIILREEASNGTEIRLILPAIRIRPIEAASSGWTPGTGLTPEQGGLHGGLPDTQENREFFHQLIADAAAGH